MAVERTSFLIIDELPAFRQGLCSIIQSSLGFSFMAVAETGEQGIEYFDKYAPSLVLVNLTLPDKSGIQVLKELGRDYPSTKIILVSTYLQPRYLFEALKNGANGFLSKDASAEEIRRAIIWVLNGKTYTYNKMYEEAPEEVLKILFSNTTVLNTLKSF